jgi:aryl-alcohol dehydrogenase-like predicted oxidoreductase
MRAAPASIFPPVDRDRAFAIIDVMRPIAERHGASVARVALAWLLHQKHVTSVIIGAEIIEQLHDNIAATELRLAEEELAALDKASALELKYPRWMIAPSARLPRPSARSLSGVILSGAKAATGL